MEIPAPNTDGAVDAGVVEATAGTPNGDELTVADPKMDLGAGAAGAVGEGVEVWPKMEEAAPKAGTAAAAVGSSEAEVETAAPKMEAEESPPPPPNTVEVTGATDDTAVAEAVVAVVVEEAPNKFKEADLEGD